MFIKRIFIDKFNERFFGKQQPVGKNYDVVVIGGGQARLSIGFYLRRTNLNYVIFDGQTSPRGIVKEITAASEEMSKTAKS